MFAQMVASIEEEAMEALFKLQPVRLERFKGIFTPAQQEFLHPEVVKFEAPSQQSVDSQIAIESSSRVTPPIKPAQASKVGRNEPCPCGKIDARTGKPLKYKKCCYPKYD
jgi:preprotein translocase subunit SecA